MAPISRKRGQSAPREVQSGALAELLGVTQRQISNLAREGMPHRGERYPVAECVQWYIRRRSPDGRPTDERAARARKLHAEAEAAELDLAERRGDLIPRSVHERRCEQFAQRLVAAVTGELPSLLRLEFPEADPIAVQAQAERIGDGLIAACRGTADDIDEPPAELGTDNGALDERAAEEDAAWAEYGGVPG